MLPVQNRLALLAVAATISMANTACDVPFFGDKEDDSGDELELTDSLRGE